MRVIAQARDDHGKQIVGIAVCSRQVLTSFLPTSAEKILETSTLRTTAMHPADMDEVNRDTLDSGAAAKEQREGSEQVPHVGGRQPAQGRGSCVGGIYRTDNAQQ